MTRFSSARRTSGASLANRNCSGKTLQPVCLTAAGVASTRSVEVARAVYCWPVSTAAEQVSWSRRRSGGATDGRTDGRTNHCATCNGHSASHDMLFEFSELGRIGKEIIMTCHELQSLSCQETEENHRNSRLSRCPDWSSNTASDVTAWAIEAGERFINVW
jgi:hypothetical protein